MENSRIEKFKEYRKSLQGESSKQSKNSQESFTGTLPMDYVIKDDSKPKEKLTFNDWIERNWYVIRIIAILVGLAAVIVAIILLSIYIGRA